MSDGFLSADAEDVLAELRSLISSDIGEIHEDMAALRQAQRSDETLIKTQIDGAVKVLSSELGKQFDDLRQHVRDMISGLERQHDDDRRAIKAEAAAERQAAREEDLKARDQWQADRLPVAVARILAELNDQNEKARAEAERQAKQDRMDQALIVQRRATMAAGVIATLSTIVSVSMALRAGDVRGAAEAAQSLPSVIGDAMP